MHSEWEKGRRNLATGSINTLQTAPINEMLSFHFSRFCLSQSQGSRREREFCPLNLEVRDENEIFYQYLRVRDETEIFFFKSHVSRWDFETRLTKFSREFSRSRNLAMLRCLANTNKWNEVILHSEILSLSDSRRNQESCFLNLGVEIQVIQTNKDCPRGTMFGSHWGFVR